MSEKVTVKEIRDALYEAFDNPPSYLERKLSVTYYCKTHGITERGINPLNDVYCDDPECHNCNLFHKKLAEQAKDFLK